MKLVLIEWIDSHAGHGWQTVAQIKADAGVLLCRSVGWLLARSRETTTIAAHITCETPPFATGEMTIPNVAIKKITTLKR